MASIYNVTFASLAQKYLNNILKREKLIAICTCLVKPLQTIHNDFIAFRVRLNEDLTFNSQTIIFEYLLNKKFNNGAVGIWIENIDSAVPETSIFTIDEGEPIKPIYELTELTADNATYIYSLEEIQSQYDFIVHIPIAVVNIVSDPKKTAEVHATIKKYKYAGKRYILKNF